MKKFPKSTRKFLRKEKARIRKAHDPETADKLIHEIVLKTASDVQNT